VLIIDDEGGIRLALQRWFARQGWSSMLAEDGEQALAMIRESREHEASRIDVVICDLHLPKLSGIELHAVLLDEDPAMIGRLIFSTGDTVADASVGGVLSSHRHVLQKPFEFSALRSMLQTLVPEA
jgi:DNA-binding response OmpR family regulator